MATTKMESENSNVYKAPRIYTFSDMDEYVCRAIAELWVPEERLAYQRINQMVGICCNSLWNQQKKLPRRLYGDAYEKCCLQSPNLREIDLYRMMEVPVLLFEKCPRIESFKGTLKSLIEYVTIHKEQNCIKSITVTGFGFQDFEDMEEEDLTPARKEIKSGMKLLMENLIHLEAMEWPTRIIYDRFDRLDPSQEYLEQLGRRASTITSWGSSYGKLYEKFKPGSNLLKLNCGWCWKDLPQELPKRHPNLRALGAVKVSLHSFSVLNGLQFIESVGLIFDGETISQTIGDNLLEMFRSFLSRHIHLKRLQLDYRLTQGFKQMVEDICRITPTIESLSLRACNLHVERDNIFTPLLTLRNLREFKLIEYQKRGDCFTFAQVTQLLAVCPKLKNVIFQPVYIGYKREFQTAEMKEVIAEYEVQGRQYREEHPNRKVQFIFNLPVS